MSVEMFAESCANEFKRLGYHRRKLTWFKLSDEVTIVFSIQKSQYSPEIWFYNYGIGINQLHESSIKSISRCDLVYRFDQYFNGVLLSAHDVLSILEMWSKKYGSIEKLKTLAKSGRLPQATTLKAIEFLTTL